jgi:hypothetical protein
LSDREAEQREKWIRRAFGFLVEEYGLTYEGYYEGRCDFASEKVRIRIQPGHKSPRIYLYRVGEPDFTHLIFERIVQYFENRIDIDDIFSRYYPDHPLEQNLRFAAEIFRRYAARIIYEIDEWWIPTQLFQYRLLEQEYESSGQLDDFLTSFRNYIDYLKSKGAIE